MVVLIVCFGPLSCRFFDAVWKEYGTTHYTVVQVCATGVHSHTHLIGLECLHTLQVSEESQAYSLQYDSAGTESSFTACLVDLALGATVRLPRLHFDL